MQEVIKYLESELIDKTKEYGLNATPKQQDDIIVLGRKIELFNNNQELSNQEQINAYAKCMLIDDIELGIVLPRLVKEYDDLYQFVLAEYYGGYTEVTPMEYGLESDKAIAKFIEDGGHVIASQILDLLKAIRTGKQFSNQHKEQFKAISDILKTMKIALKYDYENDEQLASLLDDGKATLEYLVYKKLPLL